MNFSEDFNTIIQGFQALQNHLDREFSVINSRLDYIEDEVKELEQRQSKDDDFYKGLEALIQMRNK